MNAPVSNNSSVPHRPGASESSPAVAVLERLRGGLNWAGLDRPVFFTVAGRVWSLFSGPVTMLLVTHFFTPELQGHYYMFQFIAALQVLLELGFSQCTTQFASHEFSRLSFRPGGTIEGDAAALSRLASLTRLSLKWYLWVAAIFLVIVGAGGHVYFHGRIQAEVWMTPWWLLCFGTAITLALLPFWAVLEGCNQVAFVYGFRTCAAILQAVAIWICIASRTGLYAAAVHVLCAVLLSSLVLYVRWRGFFLQLLRVPVREAVSWRNEMWPFQWRTGVSWASGYFIYASLTPLLYELRGPVAAGRMGITLQLTNALHSVAVSWTYSKAPLFGILIAHRRFAELDRVFKRAASQAIAVCALGAAVILVGLPLLKEFYPRLGDRFLPLAPVALLLAATLGNQLIFAMSVYVRAHKVEPFVPLAVANGIVTTGLACALIPRYGALGGCLAYAAVQLTLVPLITRIWARCRREWHA